MSSMSFEDDLGIESIRPTEVRVCRTKGCGLDAADHDDFCSRCREEMEEMYATREMVRYRSIIHGIHSTSRDTRRTPFLSLRMRGH
jgi:hypothetical protein